MRLAALCVCSVAVAATAAAQVSGSSEGSIRGLAYDSLLHAPLAGAEVWVRGTTRRTITDTSGAFHFEAVPEGRYVLVLSHPGLDSAGLFNLAGAVEVAAGRVATARLATPSLGTIWQHRCPSPLVAEADSGILLGLVTDAASGDRLAGAAVVGTWIVLAIRGTDVTTEELSFATLTDSVGAYVACGLSTEATVHTRAYGAGDSTGSIQVRPGARAVARRDFTLGRTARGAAIGGTVTGPDGQPVAGARVSVDSAAAVTRRDGTFLLTKLAAGTRWLRVRAVSRAPLERVVDLRDADTLQVHLSLGPIAFTLDTVRIVGTRLGRTLEGIAERRRAGFGIVRDEEDLRGRADIVSAFQGLPSLRVERRRGSLVLLFPGGRGFGGCLATVYIDGMQASHEELLTFRPEELFAIEAYPRGTGAPIQYSMRSACGVVLVWTKYLR
jgi:hypothetical protein